MAAATLATALQGGKRARVLPLDRMPRFTVSVVNRRQLLPTVVNRATPTSQGDELADLQHGGALLPAGGRGRRLHRHGLHAKKRQKDADGGNYFNLVNSSARTPRGAASGVHRTCRLLAELIDLTAAHGVDCAALAPAGTVAHNDVSGFYMSVQNGWTWGYVAGPCTRHVRICGHVFVQLHKSFCTTAHIRTGGREGTQRAVQTVPNQGHLFAKCANAYTASRATQCHVPIWGVVCLHDCTNPSLEFLRLHPASLRPGTHTRTGWEEGGTGPKACHYTTPLFVPVSEVV